MAGQIEFRELRWKDLLFMIDDTDLHPDEVFGRALFWTVICAVLTIGLPLILMS